MCTRQVRWDARGSYSTTLFSERAVSLVRAHDAAEPLFMWLAYQGVHAPAQVPRAYEDAYNGSIADAHRLTFGGMLSAVDEGIGNVTAALRANGNMLADTLFIFTTDNGGPVPDTPGGDYVGSRNAPLKGGKHSIWEGGTRGVALVHSPSTGLIPAARRGSAYNGLMHGSDWFATVARVAGADVPPAVAASLDGFDQWDAIRAMVAAKPSSSSGRLLLSGSSGSSGFGSPRSEVLYGQHDDAPNHSSPFDDAIRDAEGWKLIYGWGGLPADVTPLVNATGWTPTENACTARNCPGWARVAPPTSYPPPPPPPPSSSSSSSTSGPAPAPRPVLLFNVSLGTDDVSEDVDLAKARPDVVARLSARLDALLATGTYHLPGGGDVPDPACPWNGSWPASPGHGNYFEPWC